MDTPPDDEDETLLFNLVYCSRAIELLSSHGIDQIVSAARQHNARQHITGLLVYSSGIFFQWLEGSRDNVKQLMAVISADKRHNTIVVLSEAEEVRERVFSAWDMELVSPEDIREVLLDAISEANDSKSVAALRILMRELDSKAVGSGA